MYKTRRRKSGEIEMGLKEEKAKLITDASAAIGRPMIEGTDFEVIHQPLNHKPSRLPNDKIAVYTFYYNGNFLKIGQANIMSKARYQSHHYHIKCGRSTLTNSLVADPTMNSIVNKSNVMNWIIQNCERYDVLIDGNKYNKLTLNFIESLLHYYYNPKYENK